MLVAGGRKYEPIQIIYIYIYTHIHNIYIARDTYMYIIVKCLFYVFSVEAKCKFYFLVLMLIL